MPQFAPSAQKTAVAPITVAPAGLNCEAELFLGPNDATPVASSGIRTFLSMGSPQQVSFPIVMPASPGTYHVYVDVHAGGSLILAYQGTEDIVIAASALFYMPSEMAVSVTGDGEILGMYWDCAVALTITNIGQGSGVQTVHFWDSVGNLDTTHQITLGPGETYQFSHSQWVDFRRISVYEVYAQGDWEGDNYSVGRCTA